MSLTLILLVTVAEVALISLVFVFFLRLRRSEQLLATLQANQNNLLQRLARNAELEQELVATFSQRQEQLKSLNHLMEDRIATLRRLLEQAEGISRSPHFLREVILNCRRKGQSLEQIVAATGLARDEIELILAKAEKSL